jgi:rhodanese-related sulfurtransferase
MANSIDIEALMNLLTSGKALNLLDVRRKTDAATTPEKIPGATWHDPAHIDAWLNDLPAGCPTVVYCVKGGSVSQSVMDRLRKEGREAVFLEGGLNAWAAGGHPVVKIQPPAGE